jgi:hypothetical protein
MPTIGTAITMRAALVTLARRHNVAAPPQHVEPPLPETDDHCCVLSGLASVPVVNLQRMRFRKQSLSWLDWQMPPLHYRHGQTPVGTVDALEWRADGLHVVCTTDHPHAKCCGAFSVTATINSYVLRNVDDPATYHAEITSAWLEAISLTPTPANPQALVWERRPVDPSLQWHDLMIKRVTRLRQLVGHMQAGTALGNLPRRSNLPNFITKET